MIVLEVSLKDLVEFTRHLFVLRPPVAVDIESATEVASCIKGGKNDVIDAKTFTVVVLLQRKNRLSELIHGKVEVLRPFSKL